MIGLTSYRDYFASPKQGRSSKYESLCQFVSDLESVYGEPVQPVPTTSIGRNGSYDEYDRLLIFEHPTSLLQKTIAGFTTPNVDLHLVQLEKLFAYEGAILSCNLESTDTNRWIRNINCRRKNPKTSVYAIPTDVEFRAFFSKALANSCSEDLRRIRKNRSDFAIGDSHTVMLWRPHRTVEAIYGRTLHRSLREGLSTLVQPNAKTVTFCFGNIDLRHHFARQPDPFQAAEDLAKEYAKQADELDCEASLCELLPVIHGDRLTIKSYWYKDEPYFGSQEMRVALRNLFNETLRKSVQSSHILLTPSILIDKDGLLKEEVIEKTKGGIHIAPTYYEIAATRQTRIPENAWLV